MGTPSEEKWPGVSQLPDYKPTFPQWSGTDLLTQVPSLEPHGVDLVKQLLVYDTSKRISGTNLVLVAFPRMPEPLLLQPNGHSFTPTSVNRDYLPHQTRGYPVSFDSLIVRLFSFIAKPQIFSPSPLLFLPVPVDTTFIMLCS